MTRERLTLRKIREILRLREDVEAIQPGDRPGMQDFQQHSWGVSSAGPSIRAALAASGRDE